MKKYLIVLTLLTSFLANSQLNRGGMRNGRQRQMIQNPRKAPEPNFQVEKYLGIVIYDIEKAAKKSSIKLSSEEGKKFSSLLKKYNREIKDIRRINSFTLKSTKEMMENFQKNAQKNGDFSDRTKVQQTMVKNLTPISEALRVKDRVFDKSIKELLSEKQYKKWLKFNRKMYKVFPKDEEKKE